MIFVRLLMLLSSALMIVTGLIYLNGSKDILYSFVIGFITSSIILLGSFKSYKNIVQARVDTFDNNEFDDRDVIDKLDDPYALYEDKDISQNLDIKDIIKKEKQILKKSKRGLKNIIKDSALAFNPIRLFAYFIFILGFFYLLKSSNLSIISYILAIGLANIITISYLIYFYRNK